MIRRDWSTWLRWKRLKLRRRWDYAYALFYCSAPCEFLGACWVVASHADPEIRRLVADIYIVRPTLRALGFQDDRDGL